MLMDQFIIMMKIKCFWESWTH